MQRVLLFEECCVFKIFKIFKIYRFLSTADMIHTPARDSTRHPAKHRSKGLTCGLATAEHRLHCYVDHNSRTVVAAVVTSLHEAKHQDTTTIYPTPTLLLPFPFVRCQEHSQ